MTKNDISKLNWAKNLSNELAPMKITVNNVLRGLTETERLRFLIKSSADNTGKPEEQIKLMAVEYR